MSSLPTQTRRNAIRGAKIGALCMGGASFSTGVMICVIHHLPIPPLAITEFGVLFGALLGAGVGVLCSTVRGKYSLLGILAGFLAAALLAFPFTSAPAALRIAVLGAVVGWRLALNQARLHTQTPAWEPAR